MDSLSGTSRVVGEDIWFPKTSSGVATQTTQLGPNKSTRPYMSVWWELSTDSTECVLQFH
eukprot:5067798-Amphidinium_carterae.1